IGQELVRTRTMPLPAPPAERASVAIAQVLDALGVLEDGALQALDEALHDRLLRAQETLWLSLGVMAALLALGGAAMAVTMRGATGPLDNARGAARALTASRLSPPVPQREPAVQEPQ
ncbi:hypothetical protein CS062_19555, partial [Roseateles chitinivorans]